MIWILSLVLCLVLGLGIVFIFMPNLIAPFLVDHWRKHFDYWRY